jgi:hypothetical protein
VANQTPEHLKPSNAILDHGAYQVDIPTAAQKHPKLLELEPKLAALEKSLLAADPKMPQHLREIHTYLTQFEELAHLLTEDQIAIILDAQQRKVGIILAEETKKGKTGGSKSKPITADEL